tara:strand:+ start:31 stop:342 length:312 start_codon:yes stop_codon:yes gene_type:complete
MALPAWGLLGLARAGKIIKDVYTASKPARTAAKAAFKKAMKTKGRKDTDKLLTGTIDKVGGAIKRNPIKTTGAGGFVTWQVAKRRGKRAQREADRRKLVKKKY